VGDWRVEENKETLSDHRYVCFTVASRSELAQPSRAVGCLPRWAVGRLDREMALEAAIVQRWALTAEQQQHTMLEDVDDLAAKLRRSLSAVCDSAMPRARPAPPRRQVYWWSVDIAELRTACNSRRRVYLRSRRRRNSDDTAIRSSWEEYRQAKKALQLAIKRAKTQAREEMLEGLNRDPWGRPYLAARNKLRARGAPIIESIQEDTLDTLIDDLFPRALDHTPPTMAPRGMIIAEDGRIPPVTEEELGRVTLRLRKGKKAPGPDGVPGRALGVAMEVLGERFRALANRCLQAGRFPEDWKVGRLCLLRKEGRPADSPSAYRPLVLLNETAKLFEKILADRLVQHLEEVGPGLSEAQFGFRRSRSTTDALATLKERTMAALNGGDMIVAVSLDIRNAFNSLPYETLREALRFHGVPPYLRRVLDAYLANRHVVWERRNGRLAYHLMERGVPQGSVLGPTLWNLGYDWILRGALLPGMGVLCYADDTLVTARGSSYTSAARLAEVAASLVIERIEMLGLQVSVGKTEALLFHGTRRGPPRGAKITLHNVEIPVRVQMKYLGLHLDGRWGFGPHFAQLAPRLENVAIALGRLLPNVGGPGSLCRQLYSSIIRSMALYGAPIWADSLTTRNNRALLRRPQRVIAVREARAYRTVSWTVATLLAGDPPWELQAKVLAAAYRHRAEALIEDRPLNTEAVRRAARGAMVQRWAEELQTPAAGRDTVAAILPNLKEWLNRSHGKLTFHMTQVLTGHGCFGRYLCHTARKERSAICLDCEGAEDTARHTLQDCPAWSVQRAALVGVIGTDLSLSVVAKAILGSDRNWQAFSEFCEEVMTQKEAAERVREYAVDADPIRRARPGRRRRNYARVLQH